MKKISLVLAVIVSSIFIPSASARTTSPKMLINNEDPAATIVPCSATELGVSLECNVNWKYYFGDDRLFIQMKEDPQMYLIIEKGDPGVKWLDQLNKDKLAGMGSYQPGFALETVQIGDLKAIKVKAYSATQDDTRLSHYYLVHNGQLYRILMAVRPRDGWEQEQYLLKRVAESVRFANPDETLSRTQNP